MGLHPMAGHVISEHFLWAPNNETFSYYGPLNLIAWNVGYHMAHHVDAGVPFRNLPEYHRLLHEANYLDDTLEYPNYPALWKALAPA